MRIPITGLSSLGMLADNSPHELPLGAFNYLKNMRVQDGALETIEGHSSAYTPPSVPPIFLFPYAGAMSFSWLYASAAKAYALVGGLHYNITRQTLGADVDYLGAGWSGSNLGGIPILNNGVDEPQMWLPPASGTRLQALSNWPAGYAAKVVRPFKNHLIALNVTKGVTENPHLVLWSHPADSGTVPSSWDVTDPTKDAGEQPLTDTGGALVDCAALGSSNIIYKEDSAYRMQYIGGGGIFRFDLISTEVGLLTADAMTAFDLRGPKHVLLTADDVVIFDGNSFQSLLTKRMRKWLFNTLNADDLSRTRVRHNPQKSEIWICFCSDNSGKLEIALIWNYVDNTFTTRDLPEITAIESGVFELTGTATDTWSADATPWSGDALAWGNRPYNPALRKLFAATDEGSGAWWGFDQDTSFDGAAIPVIAERTGLTVVGMSREGVPIQDSETMKLLTEVWPRIQSTDPQDIEIYIGAQMERDGGTTWHGPFLFNPWADKKINVLISAKILSIRFVSNSTIKWKLYGYDLEIKPIGSY